MHRWLSSEPKHVTPGVAFSAGTPCALSEISIAATQRSAFVQRGFCGGYAPQKPLIRYTFRHLTDRSACEFEFSDDSEHAFIPPDKRIHDGHTVSGGRRMGTRRR